MSSLKASIVRACVSSCILLLASCASVYGDPNTVKLNAQLTGMQEVPSNPSMGKGLVEASFNKETNELTWTVTYSGLSGPAVAGHFHGPAAAGANAGVALGFKGPLDSPIKGSAMLSAEQAKDLLAGKWYVNLHTKVSPGGEVRGQVLPAAQRSAY
jgi:hypothetical protein